MAHHNELGQKGEELAAEYLVKNNFKILYRNWTFKHLEIDIIALKEGVLHFVEVKTRNSLQFGYPEEDVTKKKLKNVINAASEFQYQNPGWEKIQFDVLSIILLPDKEEYFFIEDIYV
ncbi:MAG: YraN family protein [Chitinophagaceae bacterium]|nr:YraN family protein [Chitinophagaceae bacterium]